MSTVSLFKSVKAENRGRSWNRGAISRRSKVISTSGLVAAIFNFGSGTLSGKVRSDIFMSGMVDNMGIAIGIATPSKVISTSGVAGRRDEFR